MHKFIDHDISLFNQKISEEGFSSLAIQIFKYQSKNNKVYRKYIESLNLDPLKVKTLKSIPFLPIRLFKNHAVKTGTWKEELIFESSGTTSSTPSKHFIRNGKWYRAVTTEIFNQFYQSPTRYHIIALLPHYLERKNSSLISMVDHLIKQSESELSGFYLDNIEDMVKIFCKKEIGDRKIMLIGVTFALLEVIEKYTVDLSGHIVIETGGMKGRREELTREELHEMLKKGFNITSVHSEYGMAELTSQAYSNNGVDFIGPPWFRVQIRDLYDPFSNLGEGKPGMIQIIDLANIDSCCFIETEDLGILNKNYHFSVIGRVDNSEIRGCNLLVS